MSERRNILFLDIDGVLNSVESDLAFNGGDWNPVSISLLQRVCEIATASVVMSSSWRGRRTVPELQDFLREGGAPGLARRLIGRTPHPDEMPPTDERVRRGSEIAHWLRVNTAGVADYLIVDDHADMLPEQAARFVQTDITYGFGLPDYVRALRILAPTHPDAQRSLRPRGAAAR